MCGLRLTVERRIDWKSGWILIMIFRDETSERDDLRNSTEILSQNLHSIVSQRMARSRHLREF
jgi:hypothetical protein